VYSLNDSVVEETGAALLELFTTAKQRQGA
jgi:hypothetical protein